MMEQPHIPRDDLIDVMEMTNKLESYISNVLKDNERNLALSALMSSCINSMLAQCSTLDEVVFYRNLFVQILDSSIRIIRIQGPRQPPASS
jgi:hypothetical protein